MSTLKRTSEKKPVEWTKYKCIFDFTFDNKVNRTTLAEFGLDLNAVPHQVHFAAKKRDQWGSKHPLVGTMLHLFRKCQRVIKPGLQETEAR